MSIQAKWHKKITHGIVLGAIAEAASACDEEYEYPAAVTKQDGNKPIISMYLEDFHEMQCRWEDGEL